VRTFHERLQRFARSPLHSRYLRAAYAGSLTEARRLGPDPLAGRRPRVLLCGTGSAQTTTTFLGHLAEAHGAVQPLVLDLGGEPLRASRAAGAKAAYLQADALALPLQDGCLDLVESDFFLQYFDGAGKRRLLGEWARVLSRDGVITTRDYVPRPGSWLDALLDRLRVAILRLFLRRTFHTTTEAELSAAGAAHGLEVRMSPFRARGWGLPLVRTVTARKAAT
jgi:SAM-dependent methyltransferase